MPTKSRQKTDAAHADQPDTVYAYIAGQGIYRSQDVGRRWQLMDKGAAGDGALYRSLDQAKTWERIDA